MTNKSKHRKTRDHKKKTFKVSKSGDDLRSTEDNLVATFCASIKIDEVSLEKWQQSHKNLDITYPLFLSREECEEGCVRQVKFTRRKITAGDKQKEKMTVEVIVPVGTKNGDIISFHSFGDCTNEQTGDLKVQIHLK